MADLELSLDVDGVEKAVRDLARVSAAETDIGRTAQAASQRTQAASRSTAASFTQVGTAATRASATVSQMGERVGSAASAVGSLSNALGAAGGGRAAGLVAALGGTVAQAAALGSTLGPGGAVVGGLLAVIPLVGQLAGAHRDAAEAAREHAEALRSAAQAALDLRQQEQQQRDIRAGVIGGDIDARQAAVEREQRFAEIRRLEQRLDREGQALTFANEAQRRIFDALAADRIAQIRAEIDALNVVISGGAEATTGRAAPFASDSLLQGALGRAGAARGGSAEQPPAPAGGGSRASGGARGGRDAERAQAEMNAAITRDLLGAATAGGNFVSGESATIGTVDLTEGLELQKRKAEEAAEATRDLAEAQRELQREAADAAAAFGTGWTDSIDDVVRAWQEANDAARRAGTGLISQGRLVERSLVAVGNQIAETVGGTMVSAFETALDAWLSGAASFEEAAEQMALSVVKSLVIESIVQAAVELARGASALAGVATAAEAPGHFAAAGAWAAVAGVAGGVGAAIGAFGGGGKGADKSAGGGGNDARSLGAGAVTERERSENITINVYPGGYLTRDEVANGVMDAIDYAGRSGRRIDRRAIPRGA